MIGGNMEELDINGHPLPRELRFSGSQPKVSRLPFPDEGIILSEANVLAFSQGIANACPVDQRVYRLEPGGRMMEWMGRDLLYRTSQLLSAAREVVVDRDAAWAKFGEAGKELADLRSRHHTLVEELEAAKASVRCCEAQCSSRLGKVKAKQDDLECNVAEVEQRPSNTEMIEEWMKSEEGKAAADELARPYIKSGYHRALRHHLSEVSPEAEWGGLSSPYVDIGLTDNSSPFRYGENPSPAHASDKGDDEEVDVVDP